MWKSRPMRWLSTSRTLKRCGKKTWGWRKRSRRTRRRGSANRTSSMTWLSVMRHSSKSSTNNARWCCPKRSLCSQALCSSSPRSLSLSQKSKICLLSSRRRKTKLTSLRTRYQTLRRSRGKGMIFKLLFQKSRVQEASWTTRSTLSRGRLNCSGRRIWSLLPNSERRLTSCRLKGMTSNQAAWTKMWK